MGRKAFAARCKKALEHCERHDINDTLFPYQAFSLNIRVLLKAVIEAEAE